MELRAQTKMLCRSLPGLAKCFIEYDAQGHDWIIVRWKNIDPAKIVLTDLVVPPTICVSWSEVRNRFTSRTAALRRSAALCEEVVGRTEEAHMGVWRWESESDTHYQSVFPVEAWHDLTGPNTSGDHSEGVPNSARSVQDWGLDPVMLTPSYLAHLSKHELEAMQVELNSQKSGLRELVTGELVRRYQDDKSHKPSSVRLIELEPAWNADVDQHSENPQTVPTVEVKIEVIVMATRAETQKATTRDVPADSLSPAEKHPKKRAWWQFWIPKA